MKTSQVTKVTSTPAHPRGNGLVERQNRTLLTLLGVYTSRRMLGWDEQKDGVLFAYNSTRHATTGFSSYTLQHGAEKSIPSLFVYSQRESSTSKKVCAAPFRQIATLVHRNTHQAQLRQNQKFDGHLKAKANVVGDIVWASCHRNPKSGTRKILCAWRRPDKVTNVVQGYTYWIPAKKLILSAWRNASLHRGLGSTKTFLVRPERGHYRGFVR